MPGRGPDGSPHEQAGGQDSPRRRSRRRELAYVLAEVLFLRSLFRARRDLWWPSYLLHLGLYGCAIFVGLLVAGAAATLVRPESLLPEGHGAISGLCWVAAVTGGGGMASGLVGVLLLGLCRLRDRGLREMSDGITFLNLLLLASIFGSGLVAWLAADLRFGRTMSHVASLLAGHPGSDLPWSLSVWLFLFGLFLMYLPSSRMFHFVAKYYFYHHILWDDEPMVPRGELERQMACYLRYRVRWSSSHVDTGGTWLDQVGDGKSEDADS